MENMKLYEQARVVPQEAKKSITAGRLKGMTDINPMWRIKRLTEMFGPCGVGWWYDITDKRLVDDEITKQRAAFVDIMLYFVDPETGTTSHGIPGTGGASFVAQERNGAYLSDECFKMALTDAISVAAKALGIAADVYFANDRSKYTREEESQQSRSAQQEQKPTQQEQKKPTEQEMQQFNEAYRDASERPILCEQCGKPVLPYTSAKTQQLVSVAEHVAASKKQFDGHCICLACIMKNKQDANGKS